MLYCRKRLFFFREKMLWFLIKGLDVGLILGDLKKQNKIWRLQKLGREIVVFGQVSNSGIRIVIVGVGWEGLFEEFYQFILNFFMRRGIEGLIQMGKQ